jgi:hypothetical protein
MRLTNRRACIDASSIIDYSASATREQRNDHSLNCALNPRPGLSGEFDSFRCFTALLQTYRFRIQIFYEQYLAYSRFRYQIITSYCSLKH